MSQIWHDARETTMAITAPLPFRAVRAGEEGTPFVDWLRTHLARLELSEREQHNMRERLWIFLQQHDHLMDERGAKGQTDEPMPHEYAERWRESARSAARAYSEFSAAFPGITPAQVNAELWKGVGYQTSRSRMFMPVGAVLVRNVE